MELRKRMIFQLAAYRKMRFCVNKILKDIEKLSGSILFQGSPHPAVKAFRVWFYLIHLNKL